MASSRLITAFGLAAATGVLAVAAAGVGPAGDTAWGAPQGTADTGWGAPPVGEQDDQGGQGEDRDSGGQGPPMAVPFDTAWG
ncbi:hypothetical protein [Streptomyces sp. AD55]|uniref:hypothetical protein n=1 Tax=Streptomyces sp. AD55 TaxID=3242895 RepID=UPI0035296882